MAFVISPSLVSNTLTYPLTHARIGYDNFVPESTVTGTSEVAGFPSDAVQRQTTWERWQPASMPATITFDAGATRDANYLGIAAHTLGSSGATIKFEYSLDGSAWVEIESVQFSSDKTFMLLFEQTQAQHWRLTVSGATAPVVGVIYIGKTLDMARPIYGGHSPITLSRQTVVRPTESEKGQWLGRSVIRYGLQTSYNWSNLKALWYRQYFDPFVESARFRPFFIAWRPADYPQEVAFGWTSDDIQPSNSGTRDLMDVSISVSAYADE